MSKMLRVLYVDDDDDIRLIVSMSLQIDDGMEVRCAPSGQAALDLLNAVDWRPDVVVMDVMMPGMNGFTLHRVLRERGDLSQAKTVFLTARASHAGVEEYTAAGADGVILKPFDPLRLAGEVRSIAEGK